MILQSDRELQEKVTELFELLDKDESLMNELKPNTLHVVSVLRENKDIPKTMEICDLNQNGIRMHILKALVMIKTDKDINAKLGTFVLELFDLINEQEDWEKYLTPATVKTVKTIYETQSMNETCEILNMKYVTVRSHLIKAVDRISNKRTNFRRGGKSEHAQELFDLMDSVENWKSFVTDQEAMLAIKYREVKNFNELGRQLGLAASNIYNTIFGNTRLIGVVGKIKQGLPQSERRDIDGRKKET